MQNWNKEDLLALCAYGFICTLIIIAGFAEIENYNNWISFLGSFLGAIVSLIVMLYTNNTGRKNVEKTITAENEMRKREELLRVKPYIIAHIAKGDNAYYHRRYCIDLDGTIPISSSLQGEKITFENVGVGTAIDFEIVAVRSSGYKYNELVANNYVADLLSLVVKEKITFLFEWDSGCNNNYKQYGKNIIFIIRYSDILGNRYEQEFCYEEIMDSKWEFTTVEGSVVRLNQYRVANHIPQHIERRSN